MSTRRARVQYGKTSKRINNRVEPGVVAVAIEEEVVNIEPAEPQAAVQVAKMRTKAVKDTSIEDSRRGLKQKTTKSSRSPTRAQTKKSDQDIPTRKRKRDPSPASSDLTESPDELALKPKASKRTASDISPTKRANFANEVATTSRIEKTPSRSSTPIEAINRTPKLARDLSDLFISPRKQATAPGSPQRPGHLKRMLSKAKTELLLETSSTLPSSELFLSKSMITPSSSPQKEFALPPVATGNALPSFDRKPPARDRTPSPPRRATPPPIPRSPQKAGRTYARSRSFLVELPRDTLSMEIDSAEVGSPSAKKDAPHEDESIHRESMNDLRSRWGLHESEQDLNTPINDLNSMGEMRSRGESRRFLDEVGYLLDGLDSSTGKVNTAAKRASAIEIVSKLGDSEFFRRATAADFVGKAWTALRTAGAGTSVDKILDAALVTFAAIVTKDPRQTIELARTKDFLPFLAMSVGMKEEDDILVSPPSEQETLWVRKQGLSRVDRTSLTILRAAIDNGRLVDEAWVPSSRRLASESLLRASELGQVVDQEGNEAVVECLVSELSQIPEVAKASSNEPSQYDLRHIRNCLQISQAFVAKHANKHAANVGEDQKSLLTLLARCINLWSSEMASRNASPDVGRVMDIALRYLITVTHERESLCDVLASSPNFIHNLLRLFTRWYRLYFEESGSRSKPISKEQEDGNEESDRSEVLERVSLSLGLLTQLVKHSEVAKSTIKSTKLSASCSLSGRCKEECRCSKQTSGIQILVDIFSRSDDGLNATAEAQAHFLRGNIGILLGLLCLYDSSYRAEILSRLKPVEDSDEAKIRALIEVIRDFSTLLLDVVGAVGTQEPDVDDSEAQSATSPVVAKPQVEGMDEGVQLAQAVVEGLESLL